MIQLLTRHTHFIFKDTNRVERKEGEKSKYYANSNHKKRAGMVQLILDKVLRQKLLETKEKCFIIIKVSIHQQILQTHLYLTTGPQNT